MHPRHLLVLLAIAAGSAPAGAQAASCLVAPPEVVTVTASDEEARLSVGPGGEIRVNGMDCPGATTATIDTIRVAGTAGSDEVVVVDLSGGPFSPGATPEASGASEVEIEISLEGDPGDAVELLGNDADEALRAAADGIEVTGDDDLDVLVAGIPLRLAGAGGNDTVRADGAAGSGPAAVAVALDGGDGNDVIAGGDRDDRMTGGPGDDGLEGSGGNDLLAGGDGVDRATFAGAPDSMTVSLSAGTASGWGDDLLLTVEDLTGSPFPDRLFGDEGVNRIVGAGGRDRISGDRSADLLVGESGRDFFRPGHGPDRIVGGNGQDTLTLRAAPRRTTIDLADGTAFGDGRDTFVGIESAVGSHRDDRIVGSNARNHRLVGARGDDLIIALDGDDRLRGGPGDDELLGGPGDDELDGGEGDDVLRGGPGRDHVKISPGRDIRAD